MAAEPSEGRTDGGDRFVVAVTDDLAFRVITTRTTDTVRGAIHSQKVHGETARRFGELLTGSTLVRVTMAPQLRVQGILQGADRTGQIVADSHPDGWCRGLVRQDSQADRIRIGDDAVLKMMRSLPTGDLHQGVVEVPREGGLSASLSSYMAHSEQIVSTIGVACVIDDDTEEVVAAGGYIVQLLPEVPEEQLAVMTERLHHDFAELGPFLSKHDASPDDLLDELLFRMPKHRVDEQPLRFECNCSEVRVVASLATLDRTEIESIIEDGETLEMTCEYCGTQYDIEPEKLRGLLESS